MAELIKEEYPLTVLKLSLERGESLENPTRSRASKVRCEIQVDSKTRTVLEFSTVQMGLPSFDEIRKLTYQEAQMRIPDSAFSGIASVIRDTRPGQRSALWLQLDYPNG